MGHAALTHMLDAISENAEKEALWERALEVLQCHRDGVPTLLGLCVVSLARARVSRLTTDILGDST